MNSLEWLQSWYAAQCNDTWEHDHGITIGTLDNPGWHVRIDVEGTPLEGRSMEEVGEEGQINHAGVSGAQDWIHCRVEDDCFIGAGGPTSLLLICDTFRKWAEGGAEVGATG